MIIVTLIIITIDQQLKHGVGCSNTTFAGGSPATATIRVRAPPSIISSSSSTTSSGTASATFRMPVAASNVTMKVVVRICSMFKYQVNQAML